MSGIIGQRGIGQRSGIVGSAAGSMPAFLAMGDDGTEQDLTTSYATQTVLSTVFDQGSNLNAGTDTFTAPITGKYAFQIMCYLSLLDVSDDVAIKFVTSNRFFVHNLCAGFWNTDRMMDGMSVVTDMDKNDTAYIQVVNSTDADGIWWAGTEYTWWSGYLVA